MEILAEASEGPLTETALGAIYREILSASRALQAPLAVACLGPEASFSHLASLTHFGHQAQIHPKKTIGEVFDEVERSHFPFGVVPVENSAEGSVRMTLDLLTVTPLKIRTEIFLRVTHCLVSAAEHTEQIDRVYSHPQALAQCQAWLAIHLPHAALLEADSTAGAVLRARDDKRAAAIGSRMAAQTYELPLLAEGIEDHPSNTTRFIVVGKGACSRTGRDKTSILFGTPHVPGALHAALGVFATANINLLSIVSYPARACTWEYLFFVDLAGHVQDEIVNRSLDEMKGRTAFLKVLGSYPRGEETK
jgi:chorismate mutase/prephenate dehydratase